MAACKHCENTRTVAQVEGVAECAQSNLGRIILMPFPAAQKRLRQQIATHRSLAIRVVAMTIDLIPYPCPSCSYITQVQR